jgi:hypothetical protein
MATGPSNNPMMSGEGHFCLWGEEPIVTYSASAPALHETPLHSRRDQSRDREREECFSDHPRSASTEKRESSHRTETQPYLTTRTYHSMHGSAMQYYGRLRFPMGTCDFWTPAPPPVTP